MRCAGRFASHTCTPAADGVLDDLGSTAAPAGRVQGPVGPPARVATPQAGGQRSTASEAAADGRRASSKGSCRRWSRRRRSRRHRDRAGTWGASGARCDSSAATSRVDVPTRPVRDGEEPASSSCPATSSRWTRSVRDTASRGRQAVAAVELGQQQRASTTVVTVSTGVPARARTAATEPGRTAAGRTTTTSAHRPRPPRARRPDLRRPARCTTGSSRELDALEDSVRAVRTERVRSAPSTPGWTS
jgi:hypothetical protein